MPSRKELNLRASVNIQLRRLITLFKFKLWRAASGKSICGGNTGVIQGKQRKKQHFTVNEHKNVNNANSQSQTESVSVKGTKQKMWVKVKSTLWFYSTVSLARHGLIFKRRDPVSLWQTDSCDYNLIFIIFLLFIQFKERHTNTHQPESSQATPSYWLIHHFTTETLWLPHINSHSEHIIQILHILK